MPEIRFRMQHFITNCRVSKPQMSMNFTQKTVKQSLQTLFLISCGIAALLQECLWKTGRCGSGMMLSVCTNMAALNAQNNLKSLSKKSDKTMEKLSSGFRINCAADDAAGLEISEKMRFLIRGLNQGAENTMDGISFVQTADGAMEEATGMIQRINELAVQGMNGTLSDADREAIDAEVVQLQTELKRIGKTATFNEERIFDNTSVYIRMESKIPDDLAIYNSDFKNGKAEFGGILINGDRISWDAVSPDMVRIEGGKQIFRGGVYTYRYDGPPARSYTFSCKDGSEVPDIIQHKDVKVVGNSLIIDGETFPLPSSFEDEDGNQAKSLQSDTGYLLRYHGAEILFYVPEGVYGVEEFGKNLNQNFGADRRYSWEVTYKGQELVQAVDAEVEPSIRVSKDMAAELVKGAGKYSLKVKVDEDGIALTRNGKEIEHSRMKWEDFKDKRGNGITSWINAAPQKDGGSGIRDGFGEEEFTYQYYIDGADCGNDKHLADLAFSFRLSDIASLASIKDGIDVMELACDTVKTSYQAEKISGSDSLGVQISSRITLEDEVAWEQLFDDYAADAGTLDRVNFDGSANPSGLVWTTVDGKQTAELELAGIHESSGNQVVFKSGPLTEQIGELNDTIAKNLDFWIQSKQQAFLDGAQDVSNIPPVKDLADPIGAGNVTDTGYFSEQMPPQAELYYVTHEPLESDPLPGVHIDFKQIQGDADVDRLDGHGFDSSCKTCSEHYSTRFTKETLYDDEGNQVPFRVDKVPGSYSELTMNLDAVKDRVTTLMNSEPGLAYPEAFAKTLVNIIKETGFSSHFTSYGSKGSTFYIFDYRTDSQALSATFYRKPYSSVVPGKLQLNAVSDSGSSVGMTFDYSVNDLSANLSMSMNAARNDTDGTFWKLTKPDGTVSYTQTDPSRAPAAVRNQYEAHWILANGQETSTAPTAATEGSYKKFWNLRDGTVTDTDPATVTDPQELAKYQTDINGQYTVQYPAQYHKYKIDFTVDAVDENGNKHTAVLAAGGKLSADDKKQMAEYGTRAAFVGMVKNLKFTLDRTEYTYLANVTGDERPNKASRAQFESKIVEHEVNNGIRIQHSNIKDDATFIPRYSFNLVEMGFWRTGMKTPERTERTLKAAKEALEYVTLRRSRYGACQNRLEHSYQNITNTTENVTSAESRIRDADMPKEMVAFARNHIMQQAVESMLAQANQNASGVLQLLQ